MLEIIGLKQKNNKANIDALFLGMNLKKPVKNDAPNKSDDLCKNTTVKKEHSLHILHLPIQTISRQSKSSLKC